MNLPEQRIAVRLKLLEKFRVKHLLNFLKENIFNSIGIINSVAYEKGISEVKCCAFGYAYEDGNF